MRLVGAGGRSVLRYLFEQPNLNVKRARWLVILSEIYFEIRYIKGKENWVANSVSWRVEVNHISIVSSYGIDLQEQIFWKLNMITSTSSWSRGCNSRMNVTRMRIITALRMDWLDLGTKLRYHISVSLRRSSWGSLVSSHIQVIWDIRILWKLLRSYTIDWTRKRKRICLLLDVRTISRGRLSVSTQLIYCNLFQFQNGNGRSFHETHYRFSKDIETTWFHHSFCWQVGQGSLFDCHEVYWLN